MGLERRRKRERQNRISDIKESAWRIFLRDGFDLAKLADIAEDCELGISTLYYYFRDRRQIAYSLMLDFKTEISDDLARLIERGVTYREFISGYIDAHIRDMDRFRFFVFADSYYNYHSQYDLSDPVVDEYNRVTGRRGEALVSRLAQNRDAEDRVRVATGMILGALRRYAVLPPESWPTTPRERDDMLKCLETLGASLFESIGFDVDAAIPDGAARI